MRTSKAKQYKSTIRNRIRAGASQRDLVQEFGDRVPVSTIRHWYKTMQREIAEAPSLRLIEIRDDLRDEIDELKILLRSEIDFPNKNSGVRIQAVNIFLRLIETENRLYPRSLRAVAEMVSQAGITPDLFMRELAAAYQRKESEVVG